jgi:hypothetical protein
MTTGESMDKVQSQNEKRSIKENKKWVTLTVFMDGERRMEKDLS